MVFTSGAGGKNGEIQRGERMILPVNYDIIIPRERRMVREEYVRVQEGKCYYCGGILSSPPPKRIISMRINRNLSPVNFFDWPIHPHHDHNTKMTVGAVHCYCNAVMWMYEGK